MENLLIVNKYNNNHYTDCKPEQVQESIERAKAFYSRDIELFKKNIKERPEMADFFTQRLNEYSAIIAAGFEAITWEEYKQRQADKWLSKTATECTREEYEENLDILPPLNYINYGDYTIFHVGECTTMTYYAQYICIHATKKNKKKKYYCALTDIYDRSTWIDCLLNLYKHPTSQKN